LPASRSSTPSARTAPGHDRLARRVGREHGACFLVATGRSQQHGVFELDAEIGLGFGDEVARELEPVFFLAIRDHCPGVQHLGRLPVRCEFDRTGCGRFREREIVGAERRTAERILAFGHFRVAGRKATEQFLHVGRRGLGADHGQQREKPGGRTDVDGVEQLGEITFGVVQPMQFQRDEPGVPARLLTGRIQLQPALRRQVRLAVLEIVERDARRLLGDRFIIRRLGGFAVNPGRGGVVPLLQRCIRVTNRRAGRGCLRVVTRADARGGPAGGQGNERHDEGGARKVAANADGHAPSL
jgi:hypothetical protein